MGNPVICDKLLTTANCLVSGPMTEVSDECTSRSGLRPLKSLKTAIRELGSVTPRSSVPGESLNSCGG